MTGPTGPARRRWQEVRAFALTLPAAEEDQPWDEPVVKVRRKPGPPPWRKDGRGVHGPMFLWLGAPERPEPAVAVKLTSSRDTAIEVAGAAPTTISGLGQWGWVTIPLTPARLDVDLVCEWVEESYRNVAPRRFVDDLDDLDARNPERAQPQVR